MAARTEDVQSSTQFMFDNLFDTKSHDAGTLKIRTITAVLIGIRVFAKTVFAIHPPQIEFRKIYQQYENVEQQSIEDITSVWKSFYSETDHVKPNRRGVDYLSVQFQEKDFSHPGIIFKHIYYFMIYCFTNYFSIETINHHSLDQFQRLLNSPVESPILLKLNQRVENIFHERLPNLDAYPSNWLQRAILASLTEVILDATFNQHFALYQNTIRVFLSHFFSLEDFTAKDTSLAAFLKTSYAKILETFLSIYRESLAVPEGDAEATTIIRTTVAAEDAEATTIIRETHQGDLTYSDEDEDLFDPHSPRFGLSGQKKT